MKRSAVTKIFQEKAAEAEAEAEATFQTMDTGGEEVGTLTTKLQAISIEEENQTILLGTEATGEPLKMVTIEDEAIKTRKELIIKPEDLEEGTIIISRIILSMMTKAMMTWIWRTIARTIRTIRKKMFLFCGILMSVGVRVMGSCHLRAP